MTMKLPPLKNRKWNYLALSFAFPCAGMLILMLIAGANPFGGSSMLYSDMWHQYYPFFKNFRKMLLSGDSLLYNWDIGMGLDYLGLVSYYLASPLNLLCLLVPDSWTLPLFGLLMPVKLGFAGLFFAIFLKKTFRRDDLSLPLFGSFYALCAWALGYQWNIMWLDTFALLPLVVLGTVELLRDRKFLLYTVTLFLSIFSNYYIGFFTCIFVLLVFICYQICRCKKVLRLLEDFVRIGVFTVLAIGMTAILTLPALAALQTTQSSVNTYPKDFSINMVEYEDEDYKKAREDWERYKTTKETYEKDGRVVTEEEQKELDALEKAARKSSFKPIMKGMKKVAGNMNGGLEPTFKEGLPNLYCGVGTIMLAFLFLLVKQVKLRDKICCVLLLIFFAISFVLRQLDYIWHGFHFTNMIPYRFSFLYSFVMLYMAYRAFLLRHRLQLWQLSLAGFVGIGVILLNEELNDPVYIAYNGIFFLLYFGILVFAKLDAPLPEPERKEERREYFKERKSRRRIANVALAGVMGLELILNLVNMGVTFTFTNLPDYPTGTKYSESMIRYMQEDKELFFRAEVTHSQTLNDGALNGYSGISAFTSSANVKVTEFMDTLGYAARNTYNRYNYEDSSPVANLFLNLKYMLERNGMVEDNPYFDTKHSYGSVTLQENNAYLPLGFLAQSELAELKFSNTGNAFLFQNKLFRAATGIQDNVWKTMPSSCLTIIPGKTNVEKESGSWCRYKNNTENGKGTVLTYHYEIVQEGFLCLDMSMSGQNEFVVFLNGKELYTERLSSLPQVFSVSQVKPGDEVKIEIKCGANQTGTTLIYPALLNDQVFRQGYEILAASTLQLTEFSNTRVRGIIRCDRDGLMYTSIPQNGNWSATVDGKPAQIVLVGDAMIGLELTQGLHEVEFTYKNKAYELGRTVSAVCLLVFVGITATVYRKQLKAFWEKLKKKLAK